MVVSYLEFYEPGEDPPKAAYGVPPPGESGVVVRYQKEFARELLAGMELDFFLRSLL